MLRFDVEVLFIEELKVFIVLKGFIDVFVFCFLWSLIFGLEI